MAQQITLNFPWDDDSLIKSIVVEFTATRDASTGRFTLLKARVVDVHMTLCFHAWDRGDFVSRKEVVTLPVDSVFTDPESVVAIHRWAENHFWDDAEQKMIQQFEQDMADQHHNRRMK